ncbi:MAG: SprT family zinc-dependent metalloprotease [Nitrospirae bacterium]|nr:SprT family zinc-dependent metalloprotease [Nitrospirota bacterium]
MNLQRVIERAVCRPVEIVLTNNRTSIISFRKERGRVVLRLQRLFADAPPEVLLEIAELIKRPSIKTPLVHDFFRRNQWRVRKKALVREKAEPEGKVYNLGRIFERINREYFSDRVDAVITWGKRSPKKAVRKRTLGSYNAETGTIRINPVLDCSRVPRYFVEYVVYHEMLHADIGISRRKNGRRAIHTREFRERERLFRDYRRAVQWERRARMSGFCP